MSTDHDYYVYIMSSLQKAIYIGVTNDLERRVSEHKAKIYEGFSKRYNCTILVYYEYFTDINEAIDREKQIKKWRREKKIWLIESENPNWKDLAFDY